MSGVSLPVVTGRRSSIDEGNWTKRGDDVKRLKVFKPRVPVVKRKRGYLREKKRARRSPAEDAGGERGFSPTQRKES